MKRSTIYGLILLVSAAQLSFAQSESVVRYLPLELGNSWTYIDILYPPPDFQPDTLWQGGAPISEQVVFGDTIYFKSGFEFFGVGGQREDEVGNIWAFVESEPFSLLMFDFGLEGGTIIDYGPEHPIFPGMTLTVSTSGSIEPSGQPSSINFFYQRLGAIDGDWNFTFEAGLGIISYGGGIGEVWRLHTATIGGRVINTGVDSDYFVTDQVILENNFPNPFSTTTTIRFTIPAPSYVRLSIYDVLGREVITLKEETLAHGSFTVDFDGSHLPPGNYFLRLRTDRRHETRKMIVLR